MDAIAQDAELEVHSTHEIHELVKEFLRLFDDTSTKYENEKLNISESLDESIVIKKKHVIFFLKDLKKSLYFI